MTDGARYAISSVHHRQKITRSEEDPLHFIRPDRVNVDDLVVHVAHPHFDNKVSLGLTVDYATASRLTARVAATNVRYRASIAQCVNFGAHLIGAGLSSHRALLLSSDEVDRAHREHTSRGVTQIAVEQHGDQRGAGRDT